MLKVKIKETANEIETDFIKVTVNKRNWLIYDDGNILHIQICDKNWNPIVLAD